MEWTDEAIDRLRGFWNEGLSTAEIGRRMGVSKNAVVGKAHRLLLSPRPSPIRREPEAGHAPRPATARRLVGPTLPSLAIAAEAPLQPGEPAREVPHAPNPVNGAGGPKPRPLELAARTPSDRRRTHTCCWPIGEPGTRSFRFCDDTAINGKPYCTAHAALAYVKIRDRREDAA